MIMIWVWWGLKLNGGNWVGNDGNMLIMVKWWLIWLDDNIDINIMIIIIIIILILIWLNDG